MNPVLAAVIKELRKLVEEAQWADPSQNINGTDWHERAERALAE